MAMVEAVGNGGKTETSAAEMLWQPLRLNRLWSSKETVVVAVGEADTTLAATATWANGGDSGNGGADNNQQNSGRSVDGGRGDDDGSDDSGCGGGRQQQQ